MKRRVHIIDCGLGNIMSVHNAFDKIGCEVVVCSDPELLRKAEHIVLPGVGAFGNGMERLKSLGFDKALIDSIKRGARLLGICLGMQLLFDKSYEFGENEGLHILSGEIKIMEAEAYNLRIPHIGWNDTFFADGGDSLLNGLDNPSCFYYINSYAGFPSDEKHVIGKYAYGSEYTGIVRDDNVVGVQFHPEKSQKSGLKLLDNFLTI